MEKFRGIRLSRNKIAVKVMGARSVVLLSTANEAVDLSFVN